jgi:endonuclease-3 related protein
LALRKRFGFLDWWPGETRDEVIIGAILTQNTSWKNVEKAIANLRKEKMLDLKKIAGINIRKLEVLIKPSGFYKQKAKRLKGFVVYLFGNYKNLDELFDNGVPELRKELLSLNGIGMETADSILLYAAEKPIFVIDAYTRRSMSRIYLRRKEFGYEELQSLILRELPKDLRLYKDFHAQFVELGKRYCRKTEPVCAECPLNKACKYGRLR